MEFPSLSIGRICFEFKGCVVVIYNIIKILKLNSALIVDVP